jgi:hypothetical protein
MAGVSMCVLVSCGASPTEHVGAKRQPVPTTVHTHAQHEHAVAPAPSRALPTLPDGTLDPLRIDLGGVEGVSAEQQARAEDLLRRTLQHLPRWANVETAKADGFVSVGDSFTGEEHFLRWDWIDDSVLLDPTQPESLVYRVDGAARTLEAAMFILPKQYSLDNLPDVGGPLTQFHIHDDLCFTTGSAPQVVGITSVGGTCAPPLVKFNPNAMLHVWIRQNPCGPFAALQGIAGGQIRSGEARACDDLHGEGL